MSTFSRKIIPNTLGCRKSSFQQRCFTQLIQSHIAMRQQKGVLPHVQPILRCLPERGATTDRRDRRGRGTGARNGTDRAQHGALESCARTGTNMFEGWTSKKNGRYEEWHSGKLWLGWCMLVSEMVRKILVLSLKGFWLQCSLHLDKGIRWGLISLVQLPITKLGYAVTGGLWAAAALLSFMVAICKSLPFLYTSVQVWICHSHSCCVPTPPHPVYIYIIYQATSTCYQRSIKSVFRVTSTCYQHRMQSVFQGTSTC